VTARRVLLATSCVAIVAVVALAVVGCGAASDACESCGITRATVASFGDGAITRAPAAATVTGAGNYIVLDDHGLAEFSPAGDFLGRIPRTTARGEGTPAFNAVVALGDSLVVADNRAGLLRVFGTHRAQVDSVQLPRNVRVEALSVGRWPDTIVFAGHALGRGDLFRAAVSDGFLVIDREFRSPGVPSGVRTPAYRLFHDRDGGLWAVEGQSYALLQFDTLGALVGRTVRSPAWFAKPARRPRGRLRSSVRAVAVDDQRRLWVYSAIATDTAALAWRSPEARRAGGTMALGMEELYDTVIEVLEPRTERLLARGRMPGWFVDVIPGGRAVVYARRDGRPPRLYVYDLYVHEHALQR
jgi:hypothetical protein